MIKVQLPFSTLYICQTCGQINSSEEQIAKCEAVLPWETPEVKLGDEVLLYGTKWMPWHGKYCVGLSDAAEPWGVTDFYYAKPNEKIGFAVLTRQPKHHQLCIRLKQVIEMSGQKKRAYHLGEEKDFKGIAGINWTGFTYAEFLLWQEGDCEKLKAAGLIDA